MLPHASINLGFYSSYICGFLVSKTKLFLRKKNISIVIRKCLWIT